MLSLSLSTLDKMWKINTAFVAKVIGLVPVTIHRFIKTHSISNTSQTDKLMRKRKSGIIIIFIRENNKTKFKTVRESHSRLIPSRALGESGETRTPTNTKSLRSAVWQNDLQNGIHKSRGTAGGRWRHASVIPRVLTERVLVHMRRWTDVFRFTSRFSTVLLV